MAKKVYIDVIVDDKGTTKKVAVDAQELGANLDKTSKSARSADRSLKGAAQASSNTTKNFSKMSQGITGGLVPAYATLAANIFAISAAFRFFKDAADVKALEQSQVAYATNSGIAMKSLTVGLREASGGMLGFREAAQASAIGLAKGFSPDQMEKIAEGARKVSTVLGRDFQDSFDRLTRGISKAEPELLDELGITLRLEDATNKYAKALNKSADSLTTAEKSQAIYLESMRQLDEITEGQEGRTNPFVQLANTFTDLTKSITQFLLPAFEGIANFINKNAVAALAFFGVIGASIIKSMPFVDDLKNKFNEFVESQTEAVTKAQENLDAYKNKIQEVSAAAAATRSRGEGALQRGAGRAIAQGATSPVLQRAAAGTMRGADRANLSKALKSAEAQYAKHGKIVSGIFKQVSISTVRSMSKAFELSEKKAMTFGTRVKTVLKTIPLQAKKAGAAIKLSFTRAFAAAGRAAGKFNTLMNKAMKATVILGVIQMIYDMVMALVNAPATVLKGIINVAKKSVSFIQFVANKAIDLINYVLSQVNKIPGINIDPLEQLTFAEKFTKLADDFVKNSEFIAKLEAYETQRQQVLAFNEALEELRDNAKDTARELDLILAGKATSGGIEGSKAKAQAIATLPLGDLMDTVTLAKTPEQRAKAISVLTEELSKLGALTPEVFAKLQQGDVDGVRILQGSASQFLANVTTIETAVNEMGTTLKGQSAAAVEEFAKGLQNTRDQALANAEALNLVTDVAKQLDEAFSEVGGLDAYLVKLREMEATEKSLLEGRKNLTITQVQQGFASGAIAEKLALQNKLESESLALSEKRLELRRLENTVTTGFDAAELDAHTKAIERANREVQIQEEKVNFARTAASDIGRLSATIGQSLTSNLESAINGLVQGTMTLKDAFGQMAKSIITDIAKMITKMLVFRLLQDSIGMTGFGKFLGFGARDGAIGEPVPGYASGGIARGREAGYPAILHGTEAVVPLPNGKEIPVQMRNGGGDNNVVVNVNMDGSSSQENSQGSDQRMKEMGRAISQAVQEELQRQKRPGGILSPYGAA